MIDERMLEVLAHPTGGGYTMQTADNGESSLMADNGTAYPVYGGVPVLLDDIDPLKEDIKKYFNDMWSSRKENGVKKWQDDGFSYGVCQQEALAEIDDFTGKKVLLLGAGRGNEAAMFEERGAWTLTTDILPEGLADGTGCRVAMDAEKLHVADNSFDFVYAQSMLMFVDERKVISEVQRVLKPGGRFISVEPLADGALFKFLHMVLTKFDNYDELGKTPPRYMVSEDFRWMKTQFREEHYSAFKVLTPLYHPFRILGLKGLVDLYFRMERGLISLIPPLGRQCFLSIHIWEK